jgi:hypothetical protein
MSANWQRVRAGEKVIEVAMVKITDAGRKAMGSPLEDLGEDR